MAESDSFIQEVSEEVRRDKMFSAWKKFGPFIIAAIVIAVLGAALSGWWDGRIAAQKAELGGKLLAADRIEDPAQASGAFLDVAESGEFAYPVIARLRGAAALGQAGELDAAQEQYEQVKAMADIDERFRDLAELRILMLRSETMEAQDMLGRIAPLAEEGSVWRLPALEFQAAAYLRNDEPQKAVESLRMILSLPTALPTAQGRAREVIDAIEAQYPETVATPEAAADDTEEASPEEKTE